MLGKWFKRVRFPDDPLSTLKREVRNLEVRLRDYEKLVEYTKTKLLETKVGLAIAEHYMKLRKEREK